MLLIAMAWLPCVACEMRAPDDGRGTRRTEHEVWDHGARCLLCGWTRTFTGVVAGWQRDYWSCAVDEYQPAAS